MTSTEVTRQNRILLGNQENLHDYNVSWPRDHRALEPGLTAVLRVKNEARNLPWTLPPLFRAVSMVILVDNQSDDGTPDVARRIAAETGAADRLTVTSYPFQVSRCGPEHLATPERSVHNLSYFYNWSFAHVETAYSMKWDGDMVLTEEGVETFAQLEWQLEEVEAIVSMLRHPLFVESDHVAWLDRHMINMEEYVVPMGEDYRYVKGYEWELRLSPPDVRRLKLPEGLCLELKHLDDDEFAHWTDPDAFGTSLRTMRKAREWEVYRALREGRAADVAGIVRIEAPPEFDHVITYVTDEWLPRHGRPITVPRSDQPGYADPDGSNDPDD